MSATDALASELADLLVPKLVAALNSRTAADTSATPRSPAPVLLSETAYGQRYGISPRTLQHWRRKGRAKPAFVRLGRKILYIDAVPTI